MYDRREHAGRDRARSCSNHPPVNALPAAGWSHLAEIVSALGRDDAVRVVVIAAEGRGFCAGVDVKELARDGEPDRRR